MKKLFQPNISKTGRLIRAVLGLMLLGAAVVLHRVHGLASVGFVVSGAFCLFEALRGWCVARACGVKTRW